MFRFIPVPLLFILSREVAAQSAAAADPGSGLWQLFLGLGMVLAMLAGSLWLLKKLVAPRGENAGLLRVVGATAVGTRERVVVVEVGGTWLVLGVAPGQVSALAEVPRQAAAIQSAAPATTPGAGFPDWLAKLTRRN